MKKNSLSLFAVLIVLLGLFLFYNVRSVRDDARRFVEMELINELSQLSVDIESWIGGEMRVLEVMREIIKHVPKEELIAQAQYNPFLVMRDDELDPYIGLADGTTLDNRDRFTGVAYDPRERIWYQKALEHNETVVSDVYLGVEYGRPMVTISTPLYVEDELIGVMGVDILISDILSLMDKRLNNPEAYAFILNEKRDAMVHSRNPERIGRNFMDVSNLEETAVVYGLSHGDFHTAVYEVEGVPVMAVLKKIESVDWVVGVALEREHIQKEALFFSKETTVINLLFFIVMLLIVKNLYTMEKAVFSANSILRDKVYELHAAYEQIDRVNGLLEEKSKKDGLTGVANRGYFDQEIEATWRKSIEEDAQLTLMLLDVDFFKMYNDKYGHVLGDQVLMDICSLIESLIDETDFFARVGGEEFAVLGYHKSIEDYVRLAEGIRRSIVDMGIPHEPNPHKVVTVSIGIHTTKPSPGDTIGDFYHKTDIAMYHSKETGRNKVAVFSEELMT